MPRLLKLQARESRPNANIVQDCLDKTDWQVVSPRHPVKALAPTLCHPRRHMPSARKCLTVWRQCYAQQSLFRSYLPKNDAKAVLPDESRFSGSHGPSPSPFLALNSLIAHRYHYLTTRAALSALITRRSQGYDHHHRCDKFHQEVQVSIVLQGTRSGCQTE